MGEGCAAWPCHQQPELAVGRPGDPAALSACRWGLVVSIQRHRSNAVTIAVATTAGVHGRAQSARTAPALGAEAVTVLEPARHEHRRLRRRKSMKEEAQH